MDLSGTLEIKMISNLKGYFLKLSTMYSGRPVSIIVRNRVLEPGCISLNLGSVT